MAGLKWELGMAGKSEIPFEFRYLKFGRIIARGNG
jgi:hypothetical protein